MNCHWYITKNEFDGYLPESVVCNKEKCIHEFRLLDDDENIYCYGLSSDNTSEEAFAPLDDFGTGFYGCVTIEYKNKETREWECL